MKNSFRKVPAALILMSTAFNFSNVYADNDYPEIYPFVPMDTSEIYSDVERISEDSNFERNLIRQLKAGLDKADTKRQPWTSSYWPLSKGGIADPYEDSKIPYYTDFLKTHTGVWKSSLEKYDERKVTVHPNIDELSEKELEKLAPSEKYDLLLGDGSFDLTNRLMEYMRSYGHNNRFGSLSAIHLSKNDTAQQAELYVSWGWHDSVEAALRNDLVLSTRLESQMAVKLLDAGVYTDALEALSHVQDQALAESENYVIAKSELMTDIAAWEGICNGWSTAAGLIPRPRKTVSFKLPNGKKLKFFPEDIKGLVSLYWFNSLIQDNLYKDNNGNRLGGGSINVGLRCNLRDMKRDDYGRYYDHKVDPYSRKYEPRCVGVHPAKFHLSLVNIIGKQGRSFVVERKVKSPIDNHPMSGYEMKFFNPYTGKGANTLGKVLEPITEEDQFLEYRHKDAKFVVGIETTMKYLDYVKPKRDKKNDEDDDEMVKKTMLYDLELDANYNIVGGQWRAVKAGKPKRLSSSNQKEKLNHNQPDFFWGITKEWKETGMFSNLNWLPEWDGKSTPPVEYLQAAKNAHAFEYLNSTYIGNGIGCDVENTQTGEVKRTWCELKTNKPQPLSNIINLLVEKSSGVKFENF